MKNWKKVMASVMAGMLLLSVVAGCSGGGEKKMTGMSAQIGWKICWRQALTMVRI